MASTAPIDSLFPQQTRGSKPFSTLTLKRIRISPYMVSFRKFSVVAQAAYHAPRFRSWLIITRCYERTKNNAVYSPVSLWLCESRVSLGRRTYYTWKILRSSLRKLPSSSTDPDNHLPRALVGYYEVSASARADYVGFLQASREFAHSYARFGGTHVVPKWCARGSPSIARDDAPAARRGAATQNIVQDGYVQAVQVHR
jgi:hypothetical protein